MSDEQNGEPGTVPGGEGSGAASETQPPVVVTTGNASPVEIAAVTAVISGLLAEEGEALRAAEPPGTSAWQRSQRSLRAPLEPGPGRWNG